MWLKLQKKHLKIINDCAGSLEPALSCLAAHGCPVPEAALQAILTSTGKLTFTVPELQHDLSHEAAASLADALKAYAQSLQDQYSRDIKASVAYLYDSITAMREAGWGWGEIASHISKVEVEGKTYLIKAGSLERYYRTLRKERAQGAVAEPSVINTVSQPPPEQELILLPEHTDQAIDALFDT